MSIFSLVDVNAAAYNASYEAVTVGQGDLEHSESDVAVVHGEMGKLTGKLAIVIKY